MDEFTVTEKTMFVVVIPRSGMQQPQKQNRFDKLGNEPQQMSVFDPHVATVTGNPTRLVQFGSGAAK